jgi:hypothetical protein
MSSQSTVGKRYLDVVIILINVRIVGCSFHITLPMRIGDEAHRIRDRNVARHQYPANANLKRNKKNVRIQKVSMIAGLCATYFGTDAIDSSGNESTTDVFGVNSTRL